MKHLQFVDIAFPTAVRSLFTYHAPAKMDIRPGMRVWVPLRNEYAIGMAVQVHNRKPDFKTKPVERILDDEPVMDKKMLLLTEWIHRFYYCSWGEAIQAALPVGLNFQSEKILKIKKGFKGALDKDELELVNAIEEKEVTLDEAKKRWQDGRKSGLLKKLLKNKVITVWEAPRQKVDYRTEKYWEMAIEEKQEKLVQNLPENKRGLKWVRAFEKISKLDLPASHKSLLEIDGITDYTLRRLDEEGWLVSRDLPVKSMDTNNGSYEPEKIKKLSSQQEEVFDKILSELESFSYKSFLLYGVTGSGKTEVYIHALKHTLEQGRGGLVLVPEIALTPQTVRRFYQIFGDQIAVLHSRLSGRERFEAWQSLKSGEKKIAIGPRSAVFAPVQNPGLIVVDEEHDSSYKQFDPAPRYHARDVAVVRANMNNAVVILGSATPGMVSIEAVRKKKHEMLQLPQRPSGTMPEVEVLNLIEYKGAMKGPLTVQLYEEIQRALSRKEQIILLFNRRGYASYMQCEECGHIPQSPECSVSLTYHKKKNILLCHYSGYSRKADTHCELCGSPKLKTKGSGTQQIEEEIQDLFPDARLLRMDRDTTTGKTGHQRIYEQFAAGESDILIGTQLVAKGLNFPNVTVVGVINADTELAFPSFRSGERMFQLLSQVAGRAGRAEKPGVVYVQTWKPDHPAIQCARTHDFRAFARHELANRKMLMFPPYSRMVVFHFKSKSWSKVQMVADRFCDATRLEVGENMVLGPSPSLIEWMNGQYQWEASIKLKPEYNATAIEQLLDRIFERYETMKPSGSSAVRINVDVDAVE